MRRTIALGLNLRSFSSERPHGYHVDGFAHFLILTAVFCIFFSPETPVFSRKTLVGRTLDICSLAKISICFMIHIRKGLLWTT